MVNGVHESIDSVELRYDFLLDSINVTWVMPWLVELIDSMRDIMIKLESSCEKWTSKAIKWSKKVGVGWAWIFVSNWCHWKLHLFDANFRMINNSNSRDRFVLNEHQIWEEKQNGPRFSIIFPEIFSPKQIRLISFPGSTLPGYGMWGWLSMLDNSCFFSVHSRYTVEV